MHRVRRSGTVIKVTVLVLVPVLKLFELYPALIPTHKKLIKYDSEVITYFVDVTLYFPEGYFSSLILQFLDTEKGLLEQMESGLYFLHVGAKFLSGDLVSVHLGLFSLSFISKLFCK